MILGIDLGTGSVKLMVYGTHGVQHTVSRPYRVATPHHGWAETDPQEWLEAIRSGLASIPDKEQIVAVGLSGQMHGVVLATNESGWPTPDGAAILWADQRSDRERAQFAALPPAMQHRLANPPTTGMAGLTLTWLALHDPARLQRTRSVLFPKDFVRAVLTGDRQTDFSDASGSLLYDFSTRSWYDDLIRELGLSPSILPEIRPGTEVGGTITAEAARIFGLPEGIPVVVGAGDTPAAMVGTNLRDVDTAQISIGTAAQICRPLPANALPEDGRLNVFDGGRPETRFHMAAMLNGGLALEWVRTQLGFEWEELYARLATYEARDPGDLIFVPYLSGERTPHMDPGARAAWVGLALHHTSDDLAYAALLGVAASVRMGLETLEASGPVSTLRLVGGSSRHAVWRSILGSVLGRDLHVANVTDSSAYGAVILAAEAVGAPAPAPPEFSREEYSLAPWADAYVERLRNAHAGLSELHRTV